MVAPSSLPVDRLGPARRYLVLGLGRSGTAVARLLRSVGKEVVATDNRPLSALADGVARLRSWGAAVREYDPELVQAAETLVISPGVAADHPLVLAAQRAGLEVIGELELAARLLDTPMIAVTGTNGKSTVVSLVSHIFRRLGIVHCLAGNIGNAICGELDQLRGDERYIVLEVSSFQLETTDRFHPAIACVLNIAPDHLDRHGSMEAYAAAKWRIALRQTEHDQLLVGRPLWEAVPDTVRAERLAAAAEEHALPGISARGGVLCWRRGGERAEMTLPPWALRRQAHQRENGLAAVAIARLAGAPLAEALAAWESFRDLPHRLEPVAVREGVAYIDDSKATNVHAACAALAAMTSPVVLIAGGSDKGESFGALREAARGKVAGLVLLGETADALERELRLDVPTARAASMSEAVAAAAAMAKPGDVVLLSPACASLDMFANYSERGRRFREAVEAL